MIKEYVVPKANHYGIFKSKRIVIAHKDIAYLRQEPPLGQTYCPNKYWVSHVKVPYMLRGDEVSVFGINADTIEKKWEAIVLPCGDTGYLKPGADLPDNCMLKGDMRWGKKVKKGGKN